MSLKSRSSLCLFGLMIVALGTSACSEIIGSSHTIQATPEAQAAINFELGKNTYDRQEEISFQWPIKQASIEQKFKGQKHKGIDIAKPVGTPIYAAHTGRVLNAGYNTGGYGKMVLIEFDGQWASLYAHMSEIEVSRGDEVKKGDVIGFVGSTGNSSGPHLHFEIKEYGTSINPLTELPAL